MWLIKVVPSGAYESSTDRFVDMVKLKISAMNIPFEESLWVGSKTYKPAVKKGREGDQSTTPKIEASSVGHGESGLDDHLRIVSEYQWERATTHPF